MRFLFVFLSDYNKDLFLDFKFQNALYLFLLLQLNNIKKRKKNCAKILHSCHYFSGSIAQILFGTFFPLNERKTDQIPQISNKCKKRYIASSILNRQVIYFQYFRKFLNKTMKIIAAQLLNGVTFLQSIGFIRLFHMKFIKEISTEAIFYSFIHEYMMTN